MSRSSSDRLAAAVVDPPLNEQIFAGGILGAANAKKDITIAETGDDNATVTAKLETGANIGVGNVLVTGSGANRTVEFISALALKKILDGVFDNIAGLTISSISDNIVGGPQQKLVFNTGNFGGKLPQLQQMVVDDTIDEWVDITHDDGSELLQTLGSETLTAEKLTAGNITDDVKIIYQ